MKHLQELHLHLDGALRPATVWELLQKQGTDIPVHSLEETEKMMRVPEECKTLNEYLERFALPGMVLQSEEALERVTFELVEDLANLGLEYAEIRFAPQLHTAKGCTQGQIVEAAIRGAERGMKAYPQIRVGLILCMMRGIENRAENFETIEMAKKYLGDVVCAVDIAGAEALFGTELFEDMFAKVREYGIPMTIHAGEAAGPESIWKALSYGTKRIGHGVTSIEDPELVKKLVDEKIALEVCVISNYHTKSAGTTELSKHPIRQLFDAGVHVTLNTDNMTVSNTTILKEIEVLKKELGFTDEELDQIGDYGYEARFLK